MIFTQKELSEMNTYNYRMMKWLIKKEHAIITNKCPTTGDLTILFEGEDYDD